MQKNGLNRLMNMMQKVKHHTVLSQKIAKKGVVLNSNICFFAYKIDILDLYKAYEIYKKQ